MHSLAGRERDGAVAVADELPPVRVARVERRMIIRHGADQRCDDAVKRLESPTRVLGCGGYSVASFEGCKAVSTRGPTLSPLATPTSGSRATSRYWSCALALAGSSTTTNADVNRTVNHREAPANSTDLGICTPHLSTSRPARRGSSLGRERGAPPGRCAVKWDFRPPAEAAGTNRAPSRLLPRVAGPLTGLSRAPPS